MSSDSLRNYEIRQKLGAGSYGVIYKVLNKVDKTICVLKQISLTRMNEKAKKNVTNDVCRQSMKLT
jgi:serine/threonine protein kinase